MTRTTDRFWLSPRASNRFVQGKTRRWIIVLAIGIGMVVVAFPHGEGWWVLAAVAASKVGTYVWSCWAARRERRELMTGA